MCCHHTSNEQSPHEISWMTADAERRGNDAAEAGGALNSCADVTWTTAAAQEAERGGPGAGAAEAG